MMGIAGAILTGAALAATTLMSGTGKAGAVADGADAMRGQFPYAVKLTMTGIKRPDGSSYDSACSAGLISPQWILTAGHCFHDENRNPVGGPPRYRTTATLGSANLDSGGGITVDVVDVRQAGVNDIALAKLRTPVRTRTLQIAEVEPGTGQELVLTGWGATNDQNPVPSTQLRYARVAVSSFTDYTVAVHGVWPHPDTSACTYDSGAPYFVAGRDDKATVVSVESTGPGCPHTGDETTARVDAVAPWIHQQLSQN